ncbi:MAG: response regulator [Pseudomonadota bacterium]|nr:response regulator [Pseudomonadota bacterium]
MNIDAASDDNHGQPPRAALRPETTQTGSDSADEPISILIVDDEPRNLTVLETVLSDPSYRLVRAGTGEQALLALVNEEFALLILDIRMPGMTGLELAQIIKERKKTADIPIIFLTAFYNEDQHAVEGYVSGAVDYLHKPVNATVLRAKVAVFAEIHRKNRALARSNHALIAEVTERRHIETQLRELTATLEDRVAERTQALQQSDRRLLSFMNSITDGLSLLDKDWRYTYFSEQGARMLDMRVEQILGNCIWDVFPHTRGNKFEEGFRRAVETGQTVSFEEYYPEPVHAWLHCHCYPTDEGLFVYFHDSSERKRVEQALQSATAAAEKANLAKSEFLSSMSHELRTPLSAILGFAQLIESGPPAPTPAQEQSIDRIRQAGWYLLDLINDILDLALIESGKLLLSMQAIPINEVVRESAAMVQTQAQNRDVHVSYPSLQSLHCVMADRTRLKQVLINLFSNAIKYNKPGGAVTVDCILSGAERIRLSVSDTGDGLTPDQLSQLFQAFNRLGREKTGEEGTGIGLVASKRLVEMMGGTIGVQSEVGQGSVFWIELSLTLAAESIAVLEQPMRTSKGGQASAPAHTVLYVDDNPANLSLVEELFARRPEIFLFTASNGDRAVACARSERPDAIVMDINLRETSGAEVQKILADDPATAGIPIIALGANVDVQEGVPAGFFRYLSKPIKVNELMSALHAALNIAQARADASIKVAGDPH